MNYLNELEQLKKKIIFKNIIGVVIEIIIILILLFLIIGYVNEIEYLIFIIMFIVIIISALVKLLSADDKKNFRNVYKKYIVLETFRDFFTDINYNFDIGLSKDIIEETGMMNTGDRYYSNDYFTAKYKNINFLSSDIEIKKECSSKNGKSYVTIFKGQWLIFDFNKKFKTNIQVREKFFRGSKLCGLFSDRTYHKVSLEDIEFNKIFDVYSKDDYDTFYILTPNTMEKIKDLNKKLIGNLLFCFINNKMHVGIHNNSDLFEPNIYKKINLQKEKEKIYNEIKIITEFIDTLDLDNNLFKRSV